MDEKTLTNMEHQAHKKDEREKPLHIKARHEGKLFVSIDGKSKGELFRG